MDHGGSINMEEKNKKKKSDIIEIPTVEGKFPIEIVDISKEYKNKKEK